MNRVRVEPALLRWARERSGYPTERLRKTFEKLDLWETGAEQPTLKQLEEFAHATHVPIGYLFLREPPEEELPIPDLRTMEGRELSAPSPDLLDTVYLCQRRQAWYRDWAQQVGEEPRSFVNSARLENSAEETAGRICGVLGFDLEARRRCSRWQEALRRFIEQAEGAGVLVMVSGVVGSNNHRPLDPQEFRGFALADPWAPLVFVNGADTKAAQMFTLAHELAHLWLGESALSDAGADAGGAAGVETWCNRVAAELLVPLTALREALPATEIEDNREVVQHLAQRFKVSSLVILRRLFDAGRLSRPAFEEAYARELELLRPRAKGTGGDLYRTLTARVSRRFAQALVGSAVEGQTLYRDAFRLLGIQKEATFRELSHQLGYPS